MPAAATRARFGLPEGVPLLLCPQSLFKIHPDNDELFARVLAAVPAARLVFFEGRHPAITARYRARLAAALRARACASTTRVIPAAMRPRRLPARQRGLRRDARHAALVGRQHQPGRAWLRPCRSSRCPAVHARAAKRGDARAGGRPRACRARRRRLRPHRGRLAAIALSRGASCARARRRGAVFDDAAPVQAFADALERLVPACGQSRRARPATSPIDASQSPARGWRKRRAVGYHGLSARPRCQRQSGANGAAPHAAARARRARCAMLVSTLTTRSSSATSAAMPSKSLRASAGGEAPALPAVLRSRFVDARCSENQAMPGSAKSGANAASGHERRRLACCRGAGPRDADPRTPVRRRALRTTSAPRSDRRQDRARSPGSSPASTPSAPASGISETCAS